MEKGKLKISPSPIVYKLINIEKPRLVIIHESQYILLLTPIIINPFLRLNSFSLTISL